MERKDPIIREHLTSGKSMQWHLDQMKSHVEEIRELYETGDEPYKGNKTCRDHARVEGYDLIVLTAEAFDMPEILEQIPEGIKDRFRKKRLK